MLLKLKFSGGSRNVASQNEKKTWIDEKFQILKNNIKTCDDNKLSSSLPPIYTI